MPVVSTHRLALAVAIGAGAALAIALGGERWGGLVPCALCLLERWPYRVVIILGLLAALLPPRFARALLTVAVLALVADAALGLLHVGVEAGWWKSPMPECRAPHFVAGSITQRLASMPLRPAKPCDDPSYLIPGFPLSMAAMNMTFALIFAGMVCVGMWCSDRRPE